MAPALWLMTISVVLTAWFLSSVVYRGGVPRVNYDSTAYFDHDNLHIPSTKEEIVVVVKFANANGRKIRVLGSGHSRSNIATSEDLLLSLYNFTGLVRVDEATKEVTVRAGTTFHQLNQLLDEKGLALTNLGSISDQTVAGAISTGTHGTGMKFGNLATQVNKIELISGTGKVVTVSRNADPELWSAAAVSIGMLGIITEVTIQCEDSFNLEETLKPMPLDYCMDNLIELANSAEHVKFWMVKESGSCAAFLTNRTDEHPRDNHGIHATLKVYVSEAFIWPFSWFESIGREAMRVLTTIKEPFEPHNRVDVSHRVFNIPHYLPVHYESEVVVGVDDCAQALRELWRIGEEFNIPVNFPTEVRFVRGDNIWLSPDYGRDSCHITFCLYNARKEVREHYFNKFYKVSRKFDARLHWGKYFNMTTEEVKAVYPKLEDFARVRAELDPNDVFLNEVLQNLFKF